MRGKTTGGVTIGQAAAFADVTIKTVRHYHRLGLLREPERDGSGYRSYGSADLLRLVQVRTLAKAGVPLAGIGDLLDAALRYGMANQHGTEQALAVIRLNTLVEADLRAAGVDVPRQ